MEQRTGFVTSTEMSWKPNYLSQHAMSSLMRLAILCTVFIAVPFFVAAPSEAAGNEAACDAAGANCVCSEPFQMTSFTQTVDPAFWNPTDTTTKQCGYEVANHPISRNTQDVQRRTDATALARIGNRITGFVSQGDGADGISFIGADINWSALGSTYDARASTRFYIYHSPDYNFIGDSPQCHSKLLQGNVGSHHVENFTGYMHMYDFFGSNWDTGSGGTFPIDCCSDAPGSEYTMTKDDWRGHWWRIESVMTNRGTLGWRHIVYMKDVTTTGVTPVNGGNEFVAVDTYGTDTGIDPWTAAFNTDIISNPRQLPMVANMYREDGIGTCQGWRGVAYFMSAGWDTNAGQRIGAASEMEDGGGGGGGGTLVLIRVANVIITISALLQAVFIAGWFWQRRTVAVQAAVKFWRYASEVPNMYWTYKYKKAVKKWQAQAPPMIEQKPTVIEIPKEQYKVERPWH